MGSGGYAENTTQQRKPEQATISPRRQNSAHRTRTNSQQQYRPQGITTAGLAGAEGGIADPEDEFETPIEHSEYVPSSKYGTPASPRRNVPTGSPTGGGYRSAGGEHLPGAGVASRSPKRTPSGAYRSADTTASTVPSRSASRVKRNSEEGGVAGGGATSGAGGYGYDYPDYEDRTEWDRRHSKKGGMHMPFRKQHPSAEQETEQVGGPTSTGAGVVSGTGTRRPAQAPVRTDSKGRGAAPTGDVAGHDSAAVAGAGAAVQRAGGATGAPGAGAGLGTGTGAGTRPGAAVDDTSGEGASGTAHGLSSKIKGLVSNKHVHDKAGDLAGKAGVPKNVKDIPGVDKAADAADIPGGAAGAGVAASGVGAALSSGLGKDTGGQNGTAAGARRDIEAESGAGSYAGGSDYATKSDYGARNRNTDGGDYGVNNDSYDSGLRSAGDKGAFNGRRSREHPIQATGMASSPSGDAFEYDQIDGEYPEGTHRYSHRGPATATSAVTHGNNHAYNESYQGGYEAGYLAAKRGERPPGVASPTRGTTSAGGIGGSSPRSNSASAPHKAQTTSPSKGYPRGTGRLTGADVGATSGSGALGHGKDRGSETDPAGGFSRTAGLADENVVNTSNDASNSVSPRGVPGATSAGVVGAGAGPHKADRKFDYSRDSRTNPFKQNKPVNHHGYKGTGAERYGAHDPNYLPEGDRSGGNLGGSEAYGYGKSSSPADEFADEGFGSEGVEDGKYKRSSRVSGHNRDEYGFASGRGENYRGIASHGDNTHASAGQQYKLDQAGYEKTPGGAVGPGSEEYPEDYDDVRNPGAGRLGTRRGGNDENFGHGKESGAIGGATGGNLGGLGALGTGGVAAGGLGGSETGGTAGGSGFGGVSKIIDKAGGPDNIKGSLDKTVNSKAGGVAKDKAGDLAKSKLGQGKAGDLAGKAKDIPGVNDAASKAQGAVGKGIGSKLGGGGGSGTGGAFGAVGAGGALAGAAGGAGSGQKSSHQGSSSVDYNDEDYGSNRGYGYNKGAYNDGFNSGLSHERHRGASNLSDNATGADNTYGNNYEEGYYGDEDFKKRSANDHDGYRSGVGGAHPASGTHKPVQDAAGNYSPSGDGHPYNRSLGGDGCLSDTRGAESYGQGPDYGVGDYGHERLDRDYPPDFAVGSRDGTNRRLRRPYEGENQEEEQLGVSNGDQIPSSKELGNKGGDDFFREASTDSSAYYDSSETTAGSKEQAPAATEKSIRGQSIGKTKEPPLRGPVEAGKQDTSIPRLGFQGLFGRRKSAGGSSGNEEATPTSTSRRGSLLRRLSLSKKKSTDEEQLEEPFSPEVENAEPVTRTKSSKSSKSERMAGSAASPKSKKSTEPTTPKSGKSTSSPTRGTPSNRKQSSTGRQGSDSVSPAGEPTSDEGRRFAETFGNNPSLIDPNVPTYGWGTHSEGPPSGPANASSGGGSGQGGNQPVPGTAKPDNLPVMSKDPTASKHASVDDSTTKMKKSSSNSQRVTNENAFSDDGNVEKRSSDNYVTSGKPAHGRTVSVGSHGVTEDAALGRGDYNESKPAAGLREGEGEPTSLYSDEESAYNINEASRVPRGGLDEAEEIAPDVEGTDTDAGKGEPGIFEKIKNTIMPGGDDHAATAT